MLIKNFVSKMMKKAKTKHFVCFIFKASNTLKVKCYIKSFEKIDYLHWLF